MSSIIFLTTSRCESVNLPLEAEQAAVLAALDRLGRDADLVVQAADGQLAADHADRAGDRARRGDDLVGAHRDVIAAAAGHVAHAGDDRLLDDCVSCQIRSLASADPPGLSIRSTIATTCLSSLALRSASTIVVEPMTSVAEQVALALAVMIGPTA